MIDGQRRVIASTKVTEPKLGEWHHPSFSTDHDVTGGYLGLWTKADSVTEFAGLVITGTPAK